MDSNHRPRPYQRRALTSWATCPKWCQEAELNCRHKAFQASALPLSYLGLFIFITVLNCQHTPTILGLLELYPDLSGTERTKVPLWRDWLIPLYKKIRNVKHCIINCILISSQNTWKKFWFNFLVFLKNN